MLLFVYCWFVCVCLFAVGSGVIISGDVVLFWKGGGGGGREVSTGFVVFFGGGGGGFFWVCLLSFGVGFFLIESNGSLT